MGAQKGPRFRTLSQTHPFNKTPDSVSSQFSVSYSLSVRTVWYNLQTTGTQEEIINETPAPHFEVCNLVYTHILLQDSSSVGQAL